MRLLSTILAISLFTNVLLAQEKCYESVTVPKQYETISVVDPNYNPGPFKTIVPTEYRYEKTYVEQVPTGRPQPAHVPKQYKEVITRVPIPCQHEIDEDGNCYKMVDIPHTPKTITKRVEIPCAYETNAAGECIQQVEVFCAASAKCSVRKEIQAALQTKGYEAGKGKTAFTTTTAKALEAFQKDKGMKVIPWSMESLEALGVLL